MRWNRFRFQTPSGFLILGASILCIFFLFASLGTLFAFFFPRSSLAFPLLKSALLFFSFAAILGALIASAKKNDRYPPDYLDDKEDRATVSFWPQGWIFLLVAGALGAQAVFTSPSGADEGIWLNVIRNLLLYSHYGVGQPGSFQDFSPLITVGPTVIFPLAILLKWLPFNLWVSRFYVLGWFLLSLIPLYFLYAKLADGRRLFGALFFAVVFLLHPEIQAGYSSLMGEMPALFFVTLGFLFLPSRREEFEKNNPRFLISGLFFGMAIVTKVTLILVVCLPPIWMLYDFVHRRKLDIRQTLFFWTGILLPLLPWILTKAMLTNVPKEDNLQIFFDFLVFGFRGLGHRIGRYGVMNFLKLVLLAALATLSIRKESKRPDPLVRHLMIYAFSLFFILWFFFCTDAHFIRYTTYPILLLIPLAVRILPEKLSSLPKNLFVLFPLLFLFRGEADNLKDTLLLKKNTNLPWLSEQLKEKLGGMDLTTVWTLDELDGYYLASLTRPPVFWVREEMFFKTPPPSIPYLAGNQMNASVPLPSKREVSVSYSSLQTGDLIAIGVRRNRKQEGKLYLLKIVKVPKEKANLFILPEGLPEELKETLVRNLQAIGLESYFTAEAAGKNPNAYELKLGG